MFGKRKEDRKHRYADEVSDDLSGDEAPPDPSDDPDLREALLALGRNRHAPLSPPVPSEASATEEPSKRGHSAEAAETGDSKESREHRGAGASRASEPPAAPGRPVVQTAAMLAEPEPTAAEPESSATGEIATYGALPRKRAKADEGNADSQKATGEVAPLKAEPKQLGSAAPSDAAMLAAAQEPVASPTAQLDRARSGSPGAPNDDVRAAVERAQAAEKSLADLESTVSALKAELEQARSEAATAGVALERFKRESKDQDGSLAAAEERAERLSAEIEQLRAAVAQGPAQVERLRRDAEREQTLRAAMEQAQASQAHAEAALADNLRLASDLAETIQSQEAVIAALTGLQAEVTEQRAWFESQIANLGEGERQQAAVIDALETAVRDRDRELESLREQLLEAEAKRAEEAAAFVAALERQ